MRRVALGGLEVSAVGLGCMGMSDLYGKPSWDDATATLQRALDLGVTFLDTADVYGAGHNEVLVGRAIAGRRDEVQLATKTGFDRSTGTWHFRGEPAYIKRSCETSLLRLGVDVIDLYYLHRPPVTNELEESIDAMAELVTEGKVRFLGVSEFDEEQVRRAHAVHPIAAVQSEYSLWTRDPERNGAARAMAELGIALVPYAPIGRGFFSGQLDVGRLEPGDIRRRNPRLAGDAAAANQPIVDAVRTIAQARGATPAQVAIAWTMAQPARLGIAVVPIPGTRRVARLEENAGAAAVELTAEDLAVLDGLAAGVVGARI